MIAPLHNQAPKWIVEWKSGLNIYNPMQILKKKKKKHLRKYLSVSSTQGILQILQVLPSPSYSSLLSSFVDSAKWLHCREGPGDYSSWSISSLITVPDGIFFPLPLLRLTFSALFYCNKFISVSIIEVFVLS